LQIQSFDEDNARVVVKLAVGGKMVTISQYSIELVSTKEFDAESKYISEFILKIAILMPVSVKQ